MSNDLLESLKNISKCFHPYFIEKVQDKKYWLSDSKSGQKLQLDFTNLLYEHTIVLSIDKDRDKKNDSSHYGGVAPDKLFPFLNPEVIHITKKNDFILITYHKGYLYVFLLEMKNGEKDYYLKQMNGGRLFIDLVINLLSFHEQVVKSIRPHYFGVLCFSGKKSPDKGNTRHDNNISFKNRNGLLVSEWKNASLNVEDLISAANRAVP